MIMREGYNFLHHRGKFNHRTVKSQKSVSILCHRDWPAYLSVRIRCIRNYSSNAASAAGNRPPGGLATRHAGPQIVRMNPRALAPTVSACKPNFFIHGPTSVSASGVGGKSTQIRSSDAVSTFRRMNTTAARRNSLSGRQTHSAVLVEGGLSCATEGAQVDSSCAIATRVKTETHKDAPDFRPEFLSALPDPAPIGRTNSANVCR